jgi:uncharacterized membrane protein YbhN (UPF0104 family)
MSVLQPLRSPRAIAGMVSGAIALALLLSFADIRKVGDAFQHFPPILIPIIFGLILAREAVRVVEWRYLLGALGKRPTARHSIITLLGGDASQILPAGIYFQNYLLQQTEGTAISTSLAATLAMQLLEAAVALIALAAIGVPGWSWLRLVVVVVTAGYILFLVLVSRPLVVDWLEEHSRGKRFAGWLMDQLAHFLAGLECLMRPGVVLRASLLTASYLFFTIAAFYVTVQAYGLQNVSPGAAAAVYAFVLTVVILVPLPSDLGLSEGSGVGILLAYGVPLAQGLTIMLINRFAVLLFVEIITGVVLVIFRGELRHITGGLHDVPEHALAD